MEREKTDTFLSLSNWNDGEEQALDSVLERQLPWIREQVRKRLTVLLRKKAETMDYVQDVVIQFMRYGPRFVVSDEKRLRGLLYRIVENSLHDKYDWFTARRRAISRERPLPGDTVVSLDPPQNSVSTPSRNADRNEREAWIRLGLELLEPADRELIALRQWEKAPFDEIGKKLGLSSDAARMRYNRAVGHLGDKVAALRAGRIEAVEE